MQEFCHEQWRPVRGHEDFYLISSNGQVWNLRLNRTLKQRWLDGRYLAVMLRVNGKQVTKKIHHLVAEAFIGPRPDGMLCLHRDDDRSNNTPDNLYWGTAKQNQADCTRNGTRPSRKGALNTAAKLNPSQVQAIRAMEGGHREISQQFGISSSLVSMIKRRKVWAHCA